MATSDPRPSGNHAAPGAGTSTRDAHTPSPTEAGHDEEKLDEALDETFPASDPIPPGGTTAPVPPSSPPPDARDDRSTPEPAPDR